MNKKNTLSVLLVLSIVAVALGATWIKETGLGLFLGTRTTDKVGFYGQTPVVQGSLTNTRSAELTNTITGESVAATTQAALTLGTTATAVTPVSIAAAVTAQTVALSNLNVLCGDGSTASVYAIMVPGSVMTNITQVSVMTNVTQVTVVTNVTQSGAPYGFAASTAAVVTNATGISTSYGVTTSNQMNQIIDAIRNIGIAR